MITVIYNFYDGHDIDFATLRLAVQKHIERGSSLRSLAFWQRCVKQELSTKVPASYVTF